VAAPETIFRWTISYQLKNVHIGIVLFNYLQELSSVMYGTWNLCFFRSFALNFGFNKWLYDSRSLLKSRKISLQMVINFVPQNEGWNCCTDFHQILRKSLQQLRFVSRVVTEGQTGSTQDMTRLQRSSHLTVNTLHVFWLSWERASLFLQI
jgi:hypothetical protein